MPESSASLLNQPEITHEVVTTVVKASVPPTTQIPIKYDPALGIRPPRQRPKYKYPDGPWLNEAGQISQEFIEDCANIWRTGDSQNSKAFGAMPMEDVVSRVCGFYMETKNHAKLEIHWDAFVKKNQRYVKNVQQRVEAGITIPEAEQQKVISLVPVLTSEPIESAYSKSEKLSSSNPPLLESVATVSDDIWATVATTTGQEQAQFIQPPKGAANPAMYTTTVKSEDSDYFRKLHKSQVSSQNQNLKTEIPQTLEEIKNQIRALKDRKAMPKPYNDGRHSTKIQEALNAKVARWNQLLETGVPGVIADVERQMQAQGYKVVDGQVVEAVDF